MERLPFNIDLLFIRGIVRVLFLHVVPEGAGDMDNIYNRSGEEITAGVRDKKIIMAPKHRVLELMAKHVKLNEREITTGETK